MLAALQESEFEVRDLRAVLELAPDLSRRLSSANESAAILSELVEKVQLTAGGIQVNLGIALPTNGIGAGPERIEVTSLVPMRMKRRGDELRLVLDGDEDLPRKADPALLKAVARARRWFAEITSGRVASSAEIARREGLQKGYVAWLMRLAFLSPHMIERIAEGRGPVGLDLQMLMSRRLALPLSWNEQQQQLRT